jgi:hypothetical protein
MHIFERRVMLWNYQFIMDNRIPTCKLHILGNILVKKEYVLAGHTTVPVHSNGKSSPWMEWGAGVGVGLVHFCLDQLWFCFIPLNLQ